MMIASCPSGLPIILSPGFSEKQRPKHILRQFITARGPRCDAAQLYRPMIMQELIPRRLRSQLPSAMMSGVEGTLLNVNAVNDGIHMWSKTAWWCALFLVASAPAETLARSRSPDATESNRQIAFLSEPADDAKRPPEETPRSVPQEDNKNFDGAWTFTSAGCRHTGSLPAMITSGKIIIRGGSGQVDPDGTLHSVGAGGGMTLTAVGRLSGNTGAGTFSRSDGCIGSWIAIKR